MILNLTSIDLIDMIISIGVIDMNVTAMEARKRFGELLNRVLLMDEEIIIERSGKVVAKLSSVTGVKEMDREMDREIEKKKEGKMDFRKARGLGKLLWQGSDVEEYIKKERAEWD